MWFVVVATVLLAYLVYFFVIKINKYWEVRDVPYVKPLPIFGNILSVVCNKQSVAHMIQDVYNTYPDKRYVGFYQFVSPMLLIRDPELIKRIAVKEFDAFPEHKQFVSEDVDPLWGKNLFAITDFQKWHEMRSTLSPSFTSSKMRLMFDLMKDCSKQFTDYFIKKNGGEVEMKDAFTRFTNDVIATTAFGISCDSLEQPNNTFYLMGKDATNFNGINKFRFLLSNLSPSLMKLLNVGIFSNQVSTFFRAVIKDTLQVREKQGIVRPDMINLLMAARKGDLKYEDTDNKVVDSGFAVQQESDTLKNSKRQKKISLTDEDITAQALIFFIAGFDSASALMCFATYELCINPDVQEKLRKEIDETLEAVNGDLTYETLLGMKYLDMVISEALRKWPPGTALDRVSVKPFTIKAEQPGEKTITLDKGTNVWLPVYALHRDPKYYPNPEKFDPERFSEENKDNIKPYTYLPFGVGPRNCIGSRFALLEAKLVIVEILRKFEVVPIAKTQIPMVLMKGSFNPVAEKGFWLGLKPR